MDYIIIAQERELSKEEVIQMEYNNFVRIVKDVVKSKQEYIDMLKRGDFAFVDNIVQQCYDQYIKRMTKFTTSRFANRLSRFDYYDHYKNHGTMANEKLDAYEQQLFKYYRVDNCDEYYCNGYDYDPISQLIEDVGEYAKQIWENNPTNYMALSIYNRLMNNCKLTEQDITFDNLIK